MKCSGRVLIVAGEASSSLYAQRLLELWKANGRDVETFGIGSQEMENLGFKRLGKSEELAVVGLVEVIRHFGLIRETYHALLAECDRKKPDFALLLDYPDFNLRLARDLKKRGIRVIYYISPQIWAWRKGRIHQIKKYVDEMLVVFPFEEKFYRDSGVKVTFVGHPLLDEVKGPKRLSSDERQMMRRKMGISPDEVVLGLLPGSRRSEIEHHLDLQIQAAHIVCGKRKNVRPLIVCAPSLDRGVFAAAIDKSSVTIGVIKEDPIRAVDLCDICLVASGTATLMVGLLTKPMVVMYRMNPLTAWIAKRIVKSTPYFAMVNLILGKRAVSELFQEQASPSMLAAELDRFFDQGTRSQMVKELERLETQLGHQGATEKVASCLEVYLGSTRQAVDERP